MFDLKNKVALVTGASRGIGQSIAVELARAGADVVIADILPGDETVEKIKLLKRKSFYVKVDTSNKKDVESAVDETVKRLNKIDIVVNNAGIFRPSSSETLNEEDWGKIIDINLKGYFLFAQAAGKYMIKRKEGCIINIASIAGLSGYAQAAAYCASKGGVISLTNSLSAEWGRYGIRINAICPGVIETAMTNDLLNDKKTRQAMLSKIPLGKTGKPEDIAGAAVFLASDSASYITGAKLVIDGGWISSL